MELHPQVAALAKHFSACKRILTAIGDETRQHLILEMMRLGNCSGVRVCEITRHTNLSRPAASHHLQILKTAGIVMEAPEGLVSTLQLAMEVSRALPDRSGWDG